MSVPTNSIPTPQPVQPVLEVCNLETEFRTPKGWMVAVDSVSFSLDAGQTLAIVGESGSGKSAMVRTIMGLYRPGPSFRSRGAVILDGTDIAGLSDRDMVPFRGRQIGMIFQDPMSSLNPVKKIGPQISEVLILKLGMDRKAARLRAIELLELVGMSAPEQRYDQYPMHLSGGMRQRVAIAIAIAPEPKVLIADEPTTALDVTVQAQILELLFRLQQDRRMALLLISHNLAMVAGHSDRTMVMYAGSVVEIGRRPRWFTPRACPTPARCWMPRPA